VFLVVVWGEPLVLTNQWLYIPLTVAASGTVLVSLLVAPFRPLEAVLSSRAAVWVGRRSYGVYLWHWPIFRAFSTIAYHSKVQEAGLIAAEFALTLVVVAASWRFVEKPALRLKERFGRTEAPLAVRT
jgi:peptidoglycan/LPS O-acetylase OafA/YrhL